MDKSEAFKRYFNSQQGREDFEEAAELVRNNDADGLAKYILERRFSTWEKACNYCKGYPEYKECYCNEL